MNIVLYENYSEKEAIVKDIQSAYTLTGSLRGESSIINPSFLIEHSNPSNYNYCYISDFGRYYFISNITSVRTGIWKIDCSVDVLMSFQDEILALDVTVSDASGGVQRPTYMQGEVWKTSVKTKTDVIKFPSGLLDDGEYILITSGGIAS